MAVVRFTTTRLSDLRAAGRLQEMQHATIAPFLERELGVEYGRLFADFEAESSDVRAWYTDASSTPRSINTLSEAEAEDLRQRVANMIGRIVDFASSVSAESTQKANLARILIAATTFPVEDLWTDGQQPLIVNWGFHRHDVEAGVPRPIRDRIRRPGETRMPSGVAPDIRVAEPAIDAERPLPRRRRWFRLISICLWLVFVALIAASYDHLLPACGIVGPGGIRLDACPATQSQGVVFAEGAALQALVDQAEIEAARREGACRAPHHADYVHGIKALASIGH